MCCDPWISHHVVTFKSFTNKLFCETHATCILLPNNIPLLRVVLWHRMTCLFSEHEFHSVESDKPAILFLFLYSFSFKVSFIFFRHLSRLRLYSLRVVVIIITIMIIIFIIIIAISYDLYFVSLLLLYLCFFLNLLSASVLQNEVLTIMTIFFNATSHL